MAVLFFDEFARFRSDICARRHALLHSVIHSYIHAHILTHTLGCSDFTYMHAHILTHAFHWSSLQCARTKFFPRRHTFLHSAIPSLHTCTHTYILTHNTLLLQSTLRKNTVLSTQAYILALSHTLITYMYTYLRTHSVPPVYNAQEQSSFHAGIHSGAQPYTHYIHVHILTHTLCCFSLHTFIHTHIHVHILTHTLCCFSLHISYIHIHIHVQILTHTLCSSSLQCARTKSFSSFQA